jgi:hypothetical protein
MAKLLRLLLLTIALPLVYALVVEAYLFVRADITIGSIVWFLYGFVPTFFLYFVLTLGGNPNIVFINTFRHELTHASVSILFFQFPTVFVIDLREWLKARRGGHEIAARPSVRRQPSVRRRRSVGHRRSVRRPGNSQLAVGGTGPARGDFLNALAPYFLPLFTVPLLLVRPFAPGAVVKIVDVLIGVTYAFHLVTGILEFGPHQSDVKNTGTIFSYAFVLLMHVVFLLIILLIVSGNYADIGAYFRAAWARAQAAYGATLAWIGDRLVPALQHLWEELRPAEAGGATAPPGGTLRGFAL